MGKSRRSSHTAPRMRPVLRYVIVSLLAPSGALAQEYGVTTTTAAGRDDLSVAATHVSIEPGTSAGADLAEVLTQVPGVHPRRTSYGQTSFATIRGGNARQLWVEWEGLKLSPPFGPGFDLSSSSLLGFDDIVVWRGPAATFRGSGALTGVLEFRTRHPRSDGAGMRGTAVVGSHDSRDLRVEAAAAEDDLSTRVGVAHRSSRGDFEFVDDQGVEHVRVNNDHERVGAFASARKRTGDTALLASAAYDAGERGTPGPSEFQRPFRAARLKDQHVLGLLRLDQTDIATGLDGHVVAGHQLRRLNYRNPSPFLAGEPIDQTATSATTELSVGSALWAAPNTVMLELSGRRESWSTDRPDVDRFALGVGGSVEHRLADDRVGVFGAARGELLTDSTFVVTPTVGMWWSPDAWTVRLNAGRTYRAPDLDELHLEAESVRGNPDLLPESAWSADAGLDYHLGDTTASLTYFERLGRDEILFLPVTAYLVEARNIAGTRARGAEATLDGSFENRIFGRVAYALVDARFRETDAPVPLQPSHRGFVRVEAELGRSVLPLVGSARRFRFVTEVEARSRLFLDAFGNRQAAGATFVDVGLVGGRAALGWSLFARNLLDLRTAVDALQQPLPGRTLWFAVRIGALP